MWKWIAIVSLLALIAQTGYPMRAAAIAKDQFPDTSGPQRFADAAMQRVREHDLHGALHVLSEAGAKNQPPEATAAQVDLGVRELSKQRDLIVGLGKSIGEVEFLGRDVIGKSYVVFNYLEKFERRALAWRVTFYRAKEEWVVAGIDWNQDLRPLARPDAAEAGDAR